MDFSVERGFADLTWLIAYASHAHHHAEGVVPAADRPARLRTRKFGLPHSGSRGLALGPSIAVAEGHTCGLATETRLAAA